MTKKKKKNNLLDSIINHYNTVIITCIFFVGLAISFTILHVTGGITSIRRNVLDTFLIQPDYGVFKPISNYQDLAEILKAQPQISYSKNAKYILIESSDLNCPNCAKFHVSGNQKTLSSFEKLFNDFISTGKINYSFIDLNILKGPEKHIAAYCAAEQNPKKLFEYKKVLYQNYQEEFNSEKGYIYANKIGLNLKKFKECYENKKYSNRVQELSKFNSEVLGITRTPTFTIYKIDTKEALDQNDQKKRWTEYTKVDQIIGNVDYELTIYPKIKDLIEEI